MFTQGAYFVLMMEHKVRLLPHCVIILQKCTTWPVLLRTVVSANTISTAKYKNWLQIQKKTAGGFPGDSIVRRTGTTVVVRFCDSLSWQCTRHLLFYEGFVCTYIRGSFYTFFFSLRLKKIPMLTRVFLKSPLRPVRSPKESRKGALAEEAPQQQPRVLHKGESDEWTDSEVDSLLNITLWVLHCKVHWKVQTVFRFFVHQHAPSLHRSDFSQALYIKDRGVIRTTIKRQ